MGIQNELETYVDRTFRIESWTVQDGRTVPSPGDIPLNNTAREFEAATFLYADMANSTKMVDTLSWQKCAEIYKSYLYCAARIIRNHSGDVVAFDGDRVMGIFLGGSQRTNAAKCGMRINWALKNIVRPKFAAQYTSSFVIDHKIGIDVGPVRCCRTGVRGDNDLVWVGDAPNVAAKLTDLDAGYTWITKAVYDNMNEEARISKDGRNMWEQRFWTSQNNRQIYRSAWTWPF